MLKPKHLKLYLATLTLLVPAMLCAQSDLVIKLKKGSEPEMKAKEQLLRLMTKYEVDQWMYTDTVIIAEGERPHSHPVLTINTRHLDDDVQQLAVFLHEQFHWLVYDHENSEATFNELMGIIKVPEWAMEGARSAYSPYIHLVVCDLEYQAMIRLMGKKSATQLMESFRIESRFAQYRWVYDKILTDPRVRKINKKYGFGL